MQQILQNQYAERQYLLARLGITRWADKDASALVLPQFVDVIGDFVSDDDTQAAPSAKKIPLTSASNEQLKQIQQKKSAHTQNADGIDANDHLPSAQESKPADDNQAKLPNETTANAPEIRYQLQAIRYGDWVILADDLQMTIATRALWLSLSQALAKQAQANEQLFFIRKLNYPLSGDDEYAAATPANEALALASFEGLLFGLTAGESLSMACVTPLLELLSKNKKFATLPSLAQMAQEATLKRQFWEKVVQH